MIYPLPTGKGGVKFVVLSVDYFTKWVEVEALETITRKNIDGFLRFGISYNFVTNNGKQFNYKSFQKWCSDLML